MILCIPMKRATVLIPDELDARLRLEAARRGVSLAEVWREALEAYLAPHASPGALGFFAVGNGTPADVSERVGDFVSDAVRRRNRTG